MVEDLIAKLRGKRVKDRIFALKELAKLGHEAAAARPDIVAALSDQFASVRFAAAEAIPTVGIDAASVYPIICEVVADNAIHLSVLALQAVGIDRARGMEIIREWVLSPSEEVRLTAIRFMETLDVELETELALLKECLQTELNEDNLVALLQRVHALAPSELIELIPSLITSAEQGKGTYEIASLLLDLGVPETDEALTRLLNSSIERCKLTTAELLIGAKGELARKAEAALVQLKQDSPDKRVEQLAATLLSTVRR